MAKKILIGLIGVLRITIIVTLAFYSIRSVLPSSESGNPDVPLSSESSSELVEVSSEVKTEPITQNMTEEIQTAFTEIKEPSHLRTNKYSDVIGDRYICYGMFNPATFETKEIESFEILDIDLENEKYVWHHKDDVYDGLLYKLSSDSVESYTMSYFAVDIAGFFFDGEEIMLTTLNSSGKMASGYSGYMFMPTPDFSAPIQKITGKWTATHSADLVHVTTTELLPGIGEITIEFKSDGTLIQTVDGNSYKGQYRFDTQKTFSVYVDDIIFSVGSFTESGDICMTRVDKDKDKWVDSSSFVYKKN